ncbi:MAG: hypothetical protein P8N43_05195 [Alphaproteobacteria bacterium]|nr:hypothetical protein [Alphaproteobacteria bacterium]
MIDALFFKFFFDAHGGEFQIAERLLQLLALTVHKIFMAKRETYAFGPILDPLQADVILDNLTVLSPPHVAGSHFPPSVVAFVLDTEQSVVKLGDIIDRDFLTRFITGPHGHRRRAARPQFPLGRI